MGMRLKKLSSLLGISNRCRRMASLQAVMESGQHPIHNTTDEEGASELSDSSVEQILIAKKGAREFDFSMYNRRHVALRVAYLGWDYQGFAIQDPPSVTIESTLFEALQRTKLIVDSRSCNYSRCGRTDRGVSGLGQVVALHVRSNLLEGPGVIVPEGSKAHDRKGDKTRELPYEVILNRNLPENIRILNWATVGPDFSARFSCLSRTYKYFFPLGEMNIESMQEAAQHFLGTHDFRNFCKMDINGGVTNFVRTIDTFNINTLSTSSQSTTASPAATPAYPYQMCEATISGKAFLMHQVRCMLAIIFLVGSGQENADVINYMLDITSCPCKPQYRMVSPEPLILHDCEFVGVDWVMDETAGSKVICDLQSMWTKQAVKSTMLKSMLDSMCHTHQPTPHPSSQLAPLVGKDYIVGHKYKPLRDRPTSGSFEERYEHHQARKKRKLQEASNTDISKKPLS